MVVQDDGSSTNDPNSSSKNVLTSELINSNADRAQANAQAVADQWDKLRSQILEDISRQNIQYTNKKNY